MDFINSIIDFFGSASFLEISGIIALFLVAFERLAEWTPNTWDNKVVSAIRTVFNMLALKKTAEK